MLTFKHANGNFFESDAMVILVPCNCEGVAEGLMVEYEKRFPVYFKEYQQSCLKGIGGGKWMGKIPANGVMPVKPGLIGGHIPSMVSPSSKAILDIITKRSVDDYILVDDIAKSLSGVIPLAARLGFTTIATPSFDVPIGCNSKPIIWEKPNSQLEPLKIMRRGFGTRMIKDIFESSYKSLDSKNQIDITVTIYE